MGDGLIPWLAVQQYGDYLNLCEDQLEELHYFIRVLDNVFMGRKK